MAKRIISMIEENKVMELSEFLQELNSVDISKLMMELEPKEIVLVFRLLPKDTSAEVFSYLDKEFQQTIVEIITDTEVREIVEQLFLDDTVDFIEELPANMVKKVLRNTSSERRNIINQFLRYKEDSAGSIMTIEFVDLKESITVKEDIEHIRKTCYNKETIETCFVIDKNRKLKGTISLKDLILAKEEYVLSEIMDKNVVCTNTIVDQESVTALFKEYDLVCMAVVDKEERLVGIITVDDVVDIIEQENTEDFQKMAAMSPNE